MSDIEWDADDYEPVDPIAKSAAADKWEGEDEDEDTKDNWDDEDEAEGKPPETGEPKATQVKKKKGLKERLAEKEAKKKEAEEERKKQIEAARKAAEAMTPEERSAERLRQRQVQEDADLEMAKLTFGDSAVVNPNGELDGFIPDTKEDYDKLGSLLKDKLSQFDKSAHYVGFLENLFRDLCLGIDGEEIKRLSSALNVLANEKTKQQKPAKSKKKGKAKASLSAGKDNTLEDYVVDYDYDDFI